MLAILLRHHEGALRASLMMTYGIDLDAALDMPLTTAEYVAWLPAGSPLWKAFGGPAAISDQERAIQMLDYSVRVVDFHLRKGKGSKPQPPKAPPYAHEARAVDAKTRRKAQALLERQRTQR